MPNTKTTWDDLAALGWPIQNVYERANETRDGTMKGIGDIFLNDGLADRYKWFCYNTTVGKPYVLGRVPKMIKREETAWTYDNTQNSEPYSERWTEEWSNTTTASLAIANSASITLSNRITIFDVASSGFDITISTSSTSTETKEVSHKLSRQWEMKVGPHEKLSLIRVITTSSEIVEFGQDYGITPDSLCATKGKKWKDHYYWGFYVNTLCNWPKGRMTLQGSSKVVTFSFKLVREGPKGRTTMPVLLDLHESASLEAEAEMPPLTVLEKWNEQMEEVNKNSESPVMIPGPE